MDLTRFRRRRYLHAVPTGDWLRLRPRNRGSSERRPQKLSFVACLVCGEVHEVRGETRFLRPFNLLTHNGAQEEAKVGGSFRDAPHEIGIPGRPERDVDLHSVSP
jgi:hypothetical protein